MSMNETGLLIYIDCPRYFVFSIQQRSWHAVDPQTCARRKVGKDGWADEGSGCEGRSWYRALVCLQLNLSQGQIMEGNEVKTA